MRRLGAEVRAMGRLAARPEQPPAASERIPVEVDRFRWEVRRLPRRQALAIAYHCLEDRPVRELAVLLGCSRLRAFCRRVVGCRWRGVTGLGSSEERVMGARSGSPGADVTPREAPGESLLAEAHRAALQGRWDDAGDALETLDQRSSLGAESLELLATAALLRGDRDTCRQARMRAYQIHLAGGDRRQAARCGARIGLEQLGAGEIAEAAGCLPASLTACSAWAVQAESLLAGEQECAERGYVRIATAYERLTTGTDLEGAASAAGEAVERGRRFGDPDVVALGLAVQGRALLRLGRVPEGTTRLEGSVTGALGGEVAPATVGLVLTSAIDAASEAFEFLRGDEWTGALERWCDQQTGLVAFRCRSLALRAASSRRRGRWDEALDAAERAREPTIATADPIAAALAAYEQGEVLRLRGDRQAAGAAYRHADELGLDPQPGLALLLLASEDPEAAAAAIGRALSEAEAGLARARLLAARVEIALAGDEATTAGEAAEELDAVADRHAVPALEATAHDTGATVLLAQGEPVTALGRLRPALRVWRHLGLRYDEARTRLNIARCLRQLGDEATAMLEFDAAARILTALGAQPDLDGAQALPPGTTAAPHGLTGRELEVLRLVATGLKNREIADELSVAVRTVETHVSRILTKLGVATRAAATAYAHRHGLA
jgi:DNA-binding CsgD family transcriptional regulator